MSRTTEREDFIARMAKAGVSTDDSRKLLRYARTLHRLAEAQCNGDWPCDNGQREVKPCAKCEGLWAPSVLKTHPHQKRTPNGLRYCPDCRTEVHVRDLCERLTQHRLDAYNTTHLLLLSAEAVNSLIAIQPIFSGDPRGCVLKLRVPGDSGNDFGGEGLVCVP